MAKAEIIMGEIGGHTSDNIIDDIYSNNIIGSADGQYTTTTGTAEELTNKFTVGKRYLMIFVATSTSSISVSSMTFEGAEDLDPQVYRLFHRRSSGVYERSYLRVIKATATTVKVTVTSGVSFGVRFIALD